MRFRATAVMVTVCVVLLAGSTLADHVYTHRYVVSGRATYADGTPAANVSVVAVLNGQASNLHPCWTYEGEVRVTALGIADPNRTNDHGDFEACVHAHGVYRTTPLRLRVDDRTVNVTTDADTRLSFRDVTLPPSPGNGSAPDLLVRARVWQPVGHLLKIDNVYASGEAIGGALVTVRVETDAGDITWRNLTTDRYGDVAVYVPVDEGGGIVTLTTPQIDAVTRTFNETDRRADAILLLPKRTIGAPVGGSVPFDPEPRNPVPGWWPLALAALLVAGVARRRR